MKSLEYINEKEPRSFEEFFNLFLSTDCPKETSYFEVEISELDTDLARERFTMEFREIVPDLMEAPVKKEFFHTLLTIYFYSLTKLEGSNPRSYSFLEDIGFQGHLAAELIKLTRESFVGTLNDA